MIHCSDSYTILLTLGKQDASNEYSLFYIGDWFGAEPNIKIQKAGAKVVVCSYAPARF
jgi:hypothetical protein